MGDIIDIERQSRLSDSREHATAPIRTIVAATSAIARAGLAAVLRSDARVTVVGETVPAELATLVRAIEPDVVVEQRDGARDVSSVPTVALVDDPRYALATEPPGRAGSGAYAVLSRDASSDEIIAAVVAVAAGLIAMQPRALGYAASAPAPLLAERAPAERLSPREVEVLGELARGSANKQIAAQLKISEHTVKFHIASIFAKLGVASRTEAVTAGVRRGLIML